MKFLVTGGAGFIGSHLVNLLVNKGNTVVVLDNLSHSKSENIPKSVSFIQGDVTGDLEELLKDNSFDCVFHLAAQVSVVSSIESPKHDAEINIIGSLNILEWCVNHSVRKFVFASSAAVYSPQAELPVKESALLVPQSPYGLAKFTIEQYLRSIKDSKGLDYSIFRFANVYGPGQDPKGESGVIPLFIHAILQNKPLTIFGDGNQTRDFVYVGDVVNALLKGSELSGTFNVSSGIEISIKNMIKEIQNIIGNSTSINYLSARPGELQRSVLDSSKLKSNGWSPEIIFNVGLKKTVDWIKSNLSRDEKIFIPLMPKDSMKILEVCPFSAGGCGVFARVIQEAQLLSKEGHNVRIFSSNFEKGSFKIMKSEDKIGNIKITRFPATKLGGESYMIWNFGKKALEFKPDVIIAHGYRHPHTLKALNIAEELGCKIYLVTHAPFDRSNTRSLISKLAVGIQDKLIQPAILKRFNKIISITNWEIPYLIDLRISKDKIEYIPNGIDEKFFRKAKSDEKNKILFLGRVAPIKSIETMIKAMPLLNDSKMIFEIVGPSEKKYFNYLKNLIDKLKLKDRVVFSQPIYDLDKKIKKIDSARIFILPSKSEGMPQSLIEAMARKKIVVAAKNKGSLDLINNNQNGYLFDVGNYIDLAYILNNLPVDSSRIRNNASKTVEKFKWDKIISKLNKLIKIRV